MKKNQKSEFYNIDLLVLHTIILDSNEILIILATWRHQVARSRFLNPIYENLSLFSH